jgi:hypothetical protein
VWGGYSCPPVSTGTRRRGELCWESKTGAHVCGAPNDSRSLGYAERFATESFSSARDDRSVVKRLPQKSFSCGSSGAWAAA